jgi:chitinase
VEVRPPIPLCAREGVAMLTECRRRVEKVRNAEIARGRDQEILKKAPKNPQPSTPPKQKKTNNEQQKLNAPSPGGDSKKKASSESLGGIVFTGPSNALSNMDPINAGSHWHFLTCETPGTSSKTRQTVRVICTTAGEADSNCDIIYEDGVEGTVVKIPRGCFEGDYAVLHGMVEAEDQSVPEGIKGGKVMEMTFDYNFGSVKETEEPVRFRIDFSNVPGYNDAMEGFGGI